jgi:hypothetical protein
MMMMLLNTGTYLVQPRSQYCFAVLDSTLVQCAYANGNTNNNRHVICGLGFDEHAGRRGLLQQPCDVEVEYEVLRKLRFG